MREHAQDRLSANTVRFHDIQALRFFAAAGVVLYHCHVYLARAGETGAPAVGFGPTYAWGVYLFFAISGFVLSHALTTTRPSLFLLHRFLRIFPAYWMTVALVLLGKFLVFGSAEWRQLSLGVLLLLPIGEAAYPLGIEWTLIYEMTFYLVMACIGLLPYRWRREAAMAIWLVAIGVANLLQPGYWTAFTPRLDQVLLSGFNLPFISGVLAYSWYASGRGVSLASMALVILIALPLAAQLARTEHQLLAQGIGFGALVLATAEVARRGPVLAERWLVKLGDYSYALYLLHVPVITFGISRLAAKGALTDASFYLLVLAALLFGAAWGRVETALYAAMKKRADVYFGKASR